MNYFVALLFEQNYLHHDLDLDRYLDRRSSFHSIKLPLKFYMIPTNVFKIYFLPSMHGHFQY